MYDFKLLDKKLDEFLKLGIPFYDCKVMKNGECVYRKKNGFTDNSKTLKPTGEEIYNIYSCSKLITCTAGLMLIERGMLSPEDELCKFLPEFSEMTVKTGNGLKKAENKIKIKHLFTMTAGFSYDLNSPSIQLCKKETEGKCKTLEVMKYLAKEPLLFEAGYRWEYSLCHDVLAAVIEKISNQRFSDFVRENIFDKLEMPNSSFSFAEIKKKPLCTQYKYNPETESAEVFNENPYRLGTEYESGGAGCVSTVDEYTKFLEAIRTDKLLKAETASLLFTNQLTLKQRKMPSYWVNDNYGYGYGQRCATTEYPRTDFGWGGAAGAHYFIDRKNKITAYFGTHILGFEKFMEERNCITSIIQNILSLL